MSAVADPVILVPRRSDGGHRDQLWEWVKPHWEKIGNVFEGHHDDGPFNRSAAINAAAAEAGDWDMAVIIDGDVIVSPGQVQAAVKAAELTGAPAIAFKIRTEINEQITAQILAGKSDLTARRPEKTIRNSCSSANVIPRALWDEVQGFDERFVGWGWEDVAFKYATEALAGRETIKIEGTLWHLWHPRTTEITNRHDPLQQENNALHYRYFQARRDRDATLALIAERNA